MKLSVIVPFYNAAQFLPRLENTLHAQNDADFEVIVVDDSSEPSHLAKLRESASANHWKLVELPENTGPGGARNAGIVAAQGDYLVFLDSDDELIAGALARLSAATTDKPCDVLLFDFTIVNSANEQRYTMLPHQPNELDYVSPEYALAFARGATVGKMYRTGFVQKHHLKFGAGVRHEDTVFTKSSLAWADKVTYLPESLYRYQIHEGSLIGNKSNASFEASFAALNAIRAAARGRREQEIEYVYIVEVIISCVMKFHSLRVNRKKARELFARFDLDCPSWPKNPYLRQASLRYRLYAALARHHSYFGLKTLSMAETIARKILHREH